MPDKKVQTTVIDAVWTAQHEVEMRREAEVREALLIKKVEWLRAKLQIANAALEKVEGTATFLDRCSRQFRRQVKVLRKFLARWDERNWNDLSSAALRGNPKDSTEKDHTIELLKSASMNGARKRYAEEVREDSRKHLESHAFRTEKMMLAKMNHHISGRKRGWQNSLFKFDHSARDADGNPVRTRERMAKGSNVPAPYPRPIALLVICVALCMDCVCAPGALHESVTVLLHFACTVWCSTSALPLWLFLL